MLARVAGELCGGPIQLASECLGRFFAVPAQCANHLVAERV